MNTASCSTPVDTAVLNAQAAFATALADAWRLDQMPPIKETPRVRLSATPPPPVHARHREPEQEASPCSVHTGPVGVDLNNDGKVDIILTQDELRTILLERGLGQRIVDTDDCCKGTQDMLVTMRTPTSPEDSEGSPDSSEVPMQNDETWSQPSTLRYDPAAGKPGSADEKFEIAMSTEDLQAIFGGRQDAAAALKGEEGAALTPRKRKGFPKGGQVKISIPVHEVWDMIVDRLLPEKSAPPATQESDAPPATAAAVPPPAAPPALAAATTATLPSPLSTARAVPIRGTLSSAQPAASTAPAAQAAAAPMLAPLCTTQPLPTIGEVAATSGATPSVQLAPPAAPAAQAPVVTKTVISQACTTQPLPMQGSFTAPTGLAQPAAHKPLSGCPVPSSPQQLTPAYRTTTTIYPPGHVPTGTFPWPTPGAAAPPAVCPAPAASPVPAACPGPCQEQPGGAAQRSNSCPPPQSGLVSPYASVPHPPPSPISGMRDFHHVDGSVAGFSARGPSRAASVAAPSVHHGHDNMSVHGFSRAASCVAPSMHLGLDSMPMHGQSGAASLAAPSLHCGLDNMSVHSMRHGPDGMPVHGQSRAASVAAPPSHHGLDSMPPLPAMHHGHDNMSVHSTMHHGLGGMSTAHSVHNGLDNMSVHGHSRAASVVAYHGNDLVPPPASMQRGLDNMSVHGHSRAASVAAVSAHHGPDGMSMHGYSRAASVAALSAHHGPDGMSMHGHSRAASVVPRSVAHGLDSMSAHHGHDDGFERGISDMSSISQRGMRAAAAAAAARKGSVAEMMPITEAEVSRANSRVASFVAGHDNASVHSTMHLGLDSLAARPGLDQMSSHGLDNMSAHHGPDSAPQPGFDRGTSGMSMFSKVSFKQPPASATSMVGSTSNLHQRGGPPSCAPSYAASCLPSVREGLSAAAMPSTKQLRGPSTHKHFADQGHAGQGDGQRSSWWEVENWGLGKSVADSWRRSLGMGAAWPEPFAH